MGVRAGTITRIQEGRRQEMNRFIVRSENLSQNIIKYCNHIQFIIHDPIWPADKLKVVLTNQLIMKEALRNVNAAFHKLADHINSLPMAGEDDMPQMPR
jgi:hypothetical protein